MIYVIHCNSNPAFIKVGFSKDSPRTRLSKMQTGCPFQLTALAIFEGDEDEEKRWHAKLAKFRYRGEWFKYTHEALEILGIKEDQWINRGDVPNGLKARQAEIIRKFKEERGSSLLAPTPLRHFCDSYGYSEDEVKGISAHRASFEIHRVSPVRIIAWAGRMNGHVEEMNEPIEFIIPKNLKQTLTHEEATRKQADGTFFLF